jgi:hypothetical protein
MTSTGAVHASCARQQRVERGSAARAGHDARCRAISVCGKAGCSRPRSQRPTMLRPVRSRRRCRGRSCRRTACRAPAARRSAGPERADDVASAGRRHAVGEVLAELALQRQHGGRARSAAGCRPSPPPRRWRRSGRRGATSRTVSVMFVLVVSSQLASTSRADAGRIARRWRGCRSRRHRPTRPSPMSARLRDVGLDHEVRDALGAQPPTSPAAMSSYSAMMTWPAVPAAPAAAPGAARAPRATARRTGG